MSGKKWCGEMKGWWRGSEMIKYQEETEEFCARRDRLLEMCATQLSVGQTGPLQEGVNKDGQPIIHAYGYNAYKYDHDYQPD